MRVALRMSLLLVTACLPIVAYSAEQADATKEGSKASRVRLIRSWPEPVTVGGKTALGHKEILFDYDEGVSIERTFDSTGKVVETIVHKKSEGGPRPTVQEIEEAKQMVRADQELGRIITLTGAQLQGGFILKEDDANKPCGPGTRCIQIKLNTADGLGFIRWAVVDLTKNTFAYRSYMPSTGEGH
jgi:hypothetical protein